ncbi:DNA repair protein SWI5 homolog [Zonotrichia leucophrys gambelii]|uniref:DNA repair protein SWI5 homolog n=1 Tax=Zonotrichia leucophrys gambelii TaxID=257770 RepID=UPI00313FE989
MSAPRPGHRGSTRGSGSPGSETRRSRGHGSLRRAGPIAAGRGLQRCPSLCAGLAGRAGGNCGGPVGHRVKRGRLRLSGVAGAPSLPQPSALAERAPPGAGRSPPRHPPPRALPRRVSVGGRRSGGAAFRAPIPSPKSLQPNGASEEALRCEIKELKQKDLALDQEIAQLLSEGYSLEELDRHISLLHEYNEIKDAGQMLLGKLAVIRGVTTKQLYPEYDLELSD